MSPLVGGLAASGARGIGAPSHVPVEVVTVAEGLAEVVIAGHDVGGPRQAAAAVGGGGRTCRDARRPRGRWVSAEVPGRLRAIGNATGVSESRLRP